MVALRGTNSSLNSLSHGSINHGNQTQGGMEVGIQTSMSMSQPVTGHLGGNPLPLQALNNVSLQFVPQQNNQNPVKHDQSSLRYSNSNCRQPSHHYRLLSQANNNSYPRAPTPHRSECYHPSGASGASYMPSSGGGAQGSAQTSALRVQPAPSQAAPQPPQQDLSKTTMASHNFVPQQNQTPQARPSYPPNFQYRTAQHGTRPSTLPRQQFMPSPSATAGGQMMYHPGLMYPPHMGIPQSFQQPRSQGYYPYMTQYITYASTPTSHSTPFYYPANTQQMPGNNLTANSGSGRNNPSNLVGPQGTQATPSAPAANIQHTPAQTHIHQNMTSEYQDQPRPPPVKHSKRLAIIHPVTQQNILTEMLNSNDSQNVSGDSSERQTPQPDTSLIVEEFNRKVTEAAKTPPSGNVKSNYSKNVELIVSSTPTPAQPQLNAITSNNNNNIVKSDILNVNETKCLGLDIAVEHIETPEVSAISDSPVIVPKMPNNKQLQKNSDQIVQPLVVVTNKNTPSNKQQKQNKNKPVVPQNEAIEKSEILNAALQSSNVALVTAINTPAQQAGPLAPLPVSAPVPTPVQQPQPQRIREFRERLRSDEKVKEPQPSKSNGPTLPAASAADSLQDTNNPIPSQIVTTEITKKTESGKSFITTLKSDISAARDFKSEISIKSQPVSLITPTATELLSESIEKLAKELPTVPENCESESSAIQAQAKLTLSIASCIRSNQSESKMKDINVSSKPTDPDTANGNTTDIKTEGVKEDINKNERVVKASKINKKSAIKMASNDVKDVESVENGKEETDKGSDEEHETTAPDAQDPSTDKPESVPTVFVPKYKYTDDQWSPLNKSGKKCYDINLLKQIKDDPLSKNKPNVPLLTTCNVMRTSPLQEPVMFTQLSRPSNDINLFPTFVKQTGGTRSNTPRDAKKDGRNMSSSGKGSAKLAPSSGSSSGHKPVIHLSLREDVKLNETENAWKPTRFKKEKLTEEEQKTQELYKKFRGILNKLTPQKFETLLDRVKTLEIDTQKRLEGVIDLVFEKAIDEPNFSEAYAAMCNKLSTLEVPADNPTTPEKCVNFRGLIISKCQNQFETNKVDKIVQKLAKEMTESNDPAKKRELQLMLEEENRKIRMKSVGNVRFIGELYKLKMLTFKIMVYCMNYLIDLVEEEKLECLCKLLTTIGEQVEGEAKDQLDQVFKKMQEIVEKKSNKISSRVRFMIQDVIELRRRRWVVKSVIDSQPKMMDQIQKEAEQQHRHIEMMNAPNMGSFRRDEGGRGKRGDGRRGGSNFMEKNSNNWTNTRTSYTIDTSKFKVTQKNINQIKLAPTNTGWNHGSGTKSTAQAASNPMIVLTNKNMYSALENVQADPTSIRGNKDVTSSYHSKGASIERSTFNSRGDFSASSGGGRSGSMGVARSDSGSRGSSVVPTSVPTEAPAPAPSVPQEPMPEPKKLYVKSVLDLALINADDAELAYDIKEKVEPQYHASAVTEIINYVVFEKSPKDVAVVARSLLHLVATNTISPEDFLAGITDPFEFAPEYYIDIPMLYDYLGLIIALQIEKKHISFVQVLRISEYIIAANQGHLFLKAVIKNMKDSMGPSFVKSKWQESRLTLIQWMDEIQVAKWIEENNFEFLEGTAKPSEETKKILTPAETQAKLLQLMSSEENRDCIMGWVQDNLGKASNEDWFMRALVQAICEYALFGTEGHGAPHFNRDRMNKYSVLISEFGESTSAREASCLFGIQQLIHRLEHPQGLSLEIFQFLYEQYTISVNGFIAWEESEKEPEGKAVMKVALTSFFTNIKEADNDDSGSED